MWRVLALLFLAGCPSYGHRVPNGPLPIAELNTEFDDYNMAAPPALAAYVWSTNRGSQGKHFDLWTASGNFSDAAFNFWQDGEPRVFEQLASPGNEFGPCYVEGTRSGVTAIVEGQQLVFASDRPGGKGGLDLYRYWPTTAQIGSLAALNSPSNEAYWTRTSAHEYFASDRDGKGYDIYEVNEGKIRRVDVLCSDADETALSAAMGHGGLPVLLFASNRAGGRGGWDLYYSVYRDRAWGKPKPLAQFNTPHNEFRPVQAASAIIFSSDRPGGKGGFDLYRARSPKLK